MSLSETLLSQPLGTVLVTGGSGGLGNQILLLLASREVLSQLHSIDLRMPADPIVDTQYHVGDLADRSYLHGLFATIRPNVVIHCASPRFDASDDVLRKVNIEATQILVDVAKDAGTKAFVYTSSASVISDGVTDLKGADESYPLVMGDQQPEFYTHTKAVAESYVLSQNRPTGRQDFRTCAVRPSGILGQGDNWLLPGMIDAYRRGRTNVQIGDNTNLFDFTENTNVAHAQHLAAAALLQSVDGSWRSRDRCDGEAFFVTNDEPLPFRDFAGIAWQLAGDTTQPHQIWVLPRMVAMSIAATLGWMFWLFKLGNAPLTKTTVRLSSMTRYYSVEKAKARLDYRPLIGIKDGLRRGVKDCLSRTGGT